jgi:hypothetical protein
VELFAAIRFDWQRNQMPVRALARKYDVHRWTVRQAIASPVSPDCKGAAAGGHGARWGRGVIDELLREELGRRASSVACPLSGTSGTGALKTSLTTSGLLGNERVRTMGPPGV